MAGRYDRVNGVFSKANKRYDKVTGIWYPTKTRFAKASGIWQPTYSSGVQAIFSAISWYFEYYKIDGPYSITTDSNGVNIVVPIKAVGGSHIDVLSILFAINLGATHTFTYPQNSFKINHNISYTYDSYTDFASVDLSLQRTQVYGRMRNSYVSDSATATKSSPTFTAGTVEAVDLYDYTDPVSGARSFTGSTIYLLANVNMNELSTAIRTFYFRMTIPNGALSVILEGVTEAPINF